MTTKSPLTIVKERFGNDPKEAKAKLVAAVRAFGDDLFVDRLNEDKGLERVSNAKLLHLEEVLTAVKEQFGTRAKLVDGILEAEGRAKDADYRAHFDGWPTPRLWDHYQSAKARA